MKEPSKSTYHSIVSSKAFKTILAKLGFISAILAAISALSFNLIDKTYGNEAIFKHLTVSDPGTSPQGFTHYIIVIGIASVVSFVLSVIVIYIFYRVAFAAFRKETNLPPAIHAKATSIVLIATVFINWIISTVVALAVPAPSMDFLSKSERANNFIVSFVLLVIVSVLVAFVSHKVALSRATKERDELS